MNMALLYFQMNKIRGCLSGRIQTGACVLGWRRAARVGVQLCIHERNSCGRFSLLDEAKAAAAAVFCLQHLLGAIKLDSTLRRC